MHHSRSLSFLVLFASTVGVGCIGSPDRLPPCDSWDGPVAICGRQNPEDLGYLRDRSWVVASEMAWLDPNAEAGTPPRRVGRLSAIRVRDGESVRLFPREWASVDAATSGWGEPSCDVPPDPVHFEPHGIDVGTGPDGQPMLAVVNHGGREAVEFFEIADEEEPALDWRGCVLLPEDIMANDVALLPDGGFVVTNFMPNLEGTPARAIWTMMEIGSGAETGSVLRWRRGEGLQMVANSSGSAPNGVVASPDGRSIFVAEWGGDAVYRLRFEDSGETVRDEVILGHSPDNLTWTGDGKLLVTAQHGGMRDALACGSIRKGGCDIGYSVFLIDPESLEATTLIEGRGAASVALEVGDEIWIGYFVGDQISKRAKPDGPGDAPRSPDGS